MENFANNLGEKIWKKCKSSTANFNLVIDFLEIIIWLYTTIYASSLPLSHRMHLLSEIQNGFQK